jgi:hypothetical protein
VSTPQLEAAKLNLARLHTFNVVGRLNEAVMLRLTPVRRERLERAYVVLGLRAMRLLEEALGLKGVELFRDAALSELARVRRLPIEVSEREVVSSPVTRAWLTLTKPTEGADAR